MWHGNLTKKIRACTNKWVHKLTQWFCMIILFNIKIDIKIRFIFFIEKVFHVIFYVTYRIRLSTVRFGVTLDRTWTQRFGWGSGSNQVHLGLLVQNIFIYTKSSYQKLSCTSGSVQVWQKWAFAAPQTWTSGSVQVQTQFKGFTHWTADSLYRILYNSQLFFIFKKNQVAMVSHNKSVSRDDTIFFNIKNVIEMTTIYKKQLAII